MKRFWVLVCLFLMFPTGAYAAPGLDEEVYGATIEAGKTELEARYGRLSGGIDTGEDALVLEAAHGFSSKFYGAALATSRSDPGGSRRLETLGLEGIFTLGHINGLDLDTALYVEADHNLHGPENIETKLLVEHRKGPFDLRLNLIGEKALASGAPVNFSYAASADYKVGDDVSLGTEAFGDLDKSDLISNRTEQFVGPSAKVDFDHTGPGELELRAGYLFAVGKARQETKGQLRFGLEYEF